jgi:hypothetical protein
MPKSPWSFWLVALAAAWGFDVLFWGQKPGISLLIWVAVVLAGALYLALREKSRPALASLVLAGLALVLAFMTFLRKENFTLFTSSVMAVASLFLLAITFKSGHWVGYRMVDYLLNGLDALGKVFMRPGRLMKATSHPAEDGAGGFKGFLHSAAPVLRGLLLGIPVVLVLGGLLSSADLIFAQRIELFFNNFELGKVFEYVWRLIYILAFAYVFSGLYLHGILPDKEKPAPETQKNWMRPFLGLTETTIVLALVDLLFVFFVVIQFQYLFGGHANITAAGFTYSDYARKGFFELVAVAVLSLMLYLTLAAVTKAETSRQKSIFTALTVLLVGLVLVILASALQRLMLYEDAYGFTRLRTYTHVFIYWMGLLLLATVILEVIRRRGFFALASLLVLFGFVLSMGILNVDGYIVRQNVGRARAGSSLDAQYLNSLSTDAVPEMFRQYQLAGLPEAAKERLGAELACRASDLSDAEPQSWQSFHLSERRAAGILTANGTAWQEYPVEITERGDKQIVLSLGNGYYSCSISEWMD